MGNIEMCPHCGLPKIPDDSVNEFQPACHCGDYADFDEGFGDADEDG